MKLAYILAGGRSRRFGSNKARVLWHEKPLIIALVDDLNRLGWQVAIVAQTTGDYEDLNLKVISDLYPDAGPMAGIMTALADCRSHGADHCLITSCDLIPSASEWPRNWEWLQAMETRWAKETTSIVVFEANDFMPFPGLYACRLDETAMRLWNSGKRSLRDLHQSVQESQQNSIGRISWPAKEMPKTFNTPEEWKAILDNRVDPRRIHQ